MPDRIKHKKSSESGLRFYQRITKELRKYAKDPLGSGFLTLYIGAAITVILRSVFLGVREDLLALYSAGTALVFFFLLQSTKSWIRSLLASLAILTVLAFLLSTQSAKRGGAYIIFDLSREMQIPLSNPDNPIPSLINVVADQIPDNTDVGLMIAGGVFDTTDDQCSRALELENPAPKATSIPIIQEKLSNYSKFTPQGPADIQYSVLQAIKNLSGRADVQEIVVITSGIDETCRKLNKDSLRVQAKQSNVQFKLTVVLIGQTSIGTWLQYHDYADSVYTIDTAAQLPETVSRLVAQPIFSYYAP